jgi:prepilin-type N-terminal cleavage/methylation domain-containing protein
MITPAKTAFTLIEVILALAIFAIAIPTIGQLFAIAVREEADSSNRTQAAFLARALMDEISTRRFWESEGAELGAVDAGEENGFDRRNFDDIDDYKIFQTWQAQSPPRDEAGNALNDYARFSQIADVYNVKNPIVDPNGGNHPSGRDDYNVEIDGSTGFKLVKVQISWDSARHSVILYKVFAQP